MASDPTYDASGLVVLRTADIRENIREALRNASSFGPEIRTGPESVLGQLIDPFAQQLGLAYGLLQAAHDSRRPSAAEGTHLDDAGAMVGVARLQAARSTGYLTITGTPATVVPSGTRYRVADGPVFQTTEEYTISGGGTVVAEIASVDTGPIEGAAGTITTIVDAVSGVSSVSNSADVTPGRDTESDAAYRFRRALDLSVVGAGTDAAIRAQLEQIDGVLAAACISNRTQYTDTTYGIPPWSFEPIVHPNTVDGATIAEIVWRNTPAGGGDSYGSEAYTITDDQGYEQTVRFSYAGPNNVYVTATIVQGSDYGGDAAVEAAIEAFEATLSIGDRVVPLQIAAAIVDAVDGIDELVVTAKLGSAPSASDTAPVQIALDSYPAFVIAVAS